MRQVECVSCGATGPRASTEEQAVLWWNDAPRLSGGQLLKQRSRWKSRLRAMRKQEEREAAERKKAEANSPEAKRDREYKRWASEREAWLHAPVNGDG